MISTLRLYRFHVGDDSHSIFTLYRDPFEISVWVLEDRERLGRFVGRVVKMREGDGGDPGGSCLVEFEGRDRRWMNRRKALRLREAFVRSGFVRTVGWKSATAGVRQLERLDKKLRRRVVRTNAARDRWKRRQRWVEAGDTTESGDDGSSEWGLRPWLSHNVVDTFA